MNKFFICFLTFLTINTARSQDNIVLLSPMDEDTIETLNPLLSWSYFGSSLMNNDREYYRLVLVELSENQSAEAGIIVNQPILLMDRVPGTQLFYPFDAPELEKNVWYAWQVQKISNNVLIDKSEAWKFINVEPEIPELKYTTLKKNFDGTYYEAQNGKVFFRFDGSYNTTELKVTVYNERMEIVQKQLENDTEEENPGFIPIQSGSNFYEVDLGSGLAPGIYEMRVKDAKKQTYLLKFKIGA